MNDEFAEFNQVTFAVPGRRFVIDSYVTLQDRLPIMTEFAVRLVRLVGDLSIDEMQSYFGLTGKETKALLDALQSHRLVEFRDDRVSLTSYALSRFEESSDELPRFTSVEPRSDAVDFEMLTYSPVLGDSGFPYLRNLIEVGLVDEKGLASSNHLAERAFQEHFPNIARLQRWSQAEKLDVYKVTKVEARKNFFVPVPMRLRLNGENGYIREPQASNPDAPDAFWTAIAEQMPALLPKDDAPLRINFKDFVGIFEDKVMGQFMTLNGFNIDEYLRKVVVERSVSYGTGTEPIFGNLYLPRNRAIVEEWLENAYGKEGGQGKLFASAIWCAPRYGWWGRTGLLDEAYKRFRNVVCKKGESETLHLVVQSQRKEDMAAANQYLGTSLSDIHVVAPAVRFGGRVEVLLVPGRMACVLFHISVPKSDYMWVPVGFLTTNELKVEIAHQFVKLSVDADRYIRKVWRKKEDPTDHVSPQETFGFLDYLAVVQTARGLQPLPQCF